MCRSRCQCHFHRQWKQCLYLWVYNLALIFSSAIISFCGVSIDINSSWSVSIKFCRRFSIADFYSDMKNLTTRGISSPPDGIGDILPCGEKTFASILPPYFRNNLVNLEISLGICQATRGTSLSFLLTVQAIKQLHRDQFLMPLHYLSF